MAIRRCPECNYKIPDQPPSCPKCGRPFTMNSAFNDVSLPDAGFKNENPVLQNKKLKNKSKDEIYKEKKQQLKYWQTIFEQEKQEHEKRKSEHDTYVNTINEELEQIQKQMQNIRDKYKMHMVWAVLAVLGVLLLTGVPIGIYKWNELHKYQQQLETELSRYSGEIEIQEQDLQQQIETLTQQLESLQ